jgi:hypothetical protein
MPKRGKADLSQPTAEDFRHLLAFRVSLRRFQHWSETQARVAGLTPTQHQLLVAVKDTPASCPRRSAISRRTCCCVITARWSWWTGWRRLASSGACLILEMPG